MSDSNCCHDDGPTFHVAGFSLDTGMLAVSFHSHDDPTDEHDASTFFHMSFREDHPAIKPILDELCKRCCATAAGRMIGLVGVGEMPDSPRAITAARVYVCRICEVTKEGPVDEPPPGWVCQGASSWCQFHAPSGG